ncbi:MAG: hypothetical protein HC935_00545 [Pseudanabaena sp. SU_2_4]|nr:hypothetical protein [Pseudanabaena sp. SU_2_4]
MNKYYTSSLYIYAWRLQEDLPPLDLAIADVVSALSVWRPNDPMYRFGDPPRKFKQIDRESVRQYLNLLKEIDSARGETFDTVSLVFMSSKDSKIRLLITYHASGKKLVISHDINSKEIYHPTQNKLEISYECLKEQPLQAIESSEVLWKVCRAFGAFTGGFGGHPPSFGHNDLKKYPRADRIFSWIPKIRTNYLSICTSRDLVDKLLGLHTSRNTRQRKSLDCAMGKDTRGRRWCICSDCIS